MGKRNKGSEAQDESRQERLETDRVWDDPRRSPPTHPGSRARGSLLKVPLVERSLAMLDRVDFMEEQVTEQQSEFAAVGACARAWGITRRQAQKYLRAVKRRWARESSEEREARRNRIRRKIQRTYAKAMAHHKPMTVGDGFGNQHVEYHPEPNEAAALKALELEARLDGLFEAEKLDVTVGGTVETRVMAVIAKAYGLESAAVVEGEAEPAQLPAGEESEP